MNYDLNGLTWEEVFEIKFSCEVMLREYEKYNDEQSVEICKRLNGIIAKCRISMHLD